MNDNEEKRSIMKLLILWRGLPFRFSPPLSRPYYFIKFFSSKTSITLASPLNMYDTSLLDNVRLEIIPVPTLTKFYSKALFSIINRITLTNICYTRDFNIAKSYYPSFQKLIIEILKKEDFDVIYSDSRVSSYLFYYKLKGKIKAPIILEFFNPELYSERQFFKFGTISYKFIHLFRYLLFRLFEVEQYKHFDAGIYVSKTHLELSKPFIPKKCFVIPPGVDLEFFKPSNTESTDPTILFTGSINYIPNISAILWFYYKIYPYIKQKVPNVKFYIVGRNPSARIMKLSIDKSIIVTGEVEDIRPYFAKASVFINPIVLDDGGIKNKVLEAMAMGKAIVSTPLGARDLNVIDDKNILIAQNEIDFANKVIELLKDENKRKKLGKEARKFVEKNYSWEKQSSMLYDILKFFAERSKK
ncbi:MAG: glycosyltransferase family 4 protein [Candidatus Aenigmatarchaeota archaeon]